MSRDEELRAALALELDLQGRLLADIKHALVDRGLIAAERRTLE